MWSNRSRPGQTLIENVLRDQKITNMSTMRTKSYLSCRSRSTSPSAPKAHGESSTASLSPPTAQNQPPPRSCSPPSRTVLSADEIHGLPANNGFHQLSARPANWLPSSVPSRVLPFRRRARCTTTQVALRCRDRCPPACNRSRRWACASPSSQPLHHRKIGQRNRPESTEKP
jgi:hypothetical protein